MVSGSGIGSSGGRLNSCPEANTLDDFEDSDGEVSKIDFRGVNLRTKKKRDASGGNENDGCGAVGADNLEHQQPERPMSWEGELSDQEMSSNTITNQVKFITLQLQSRFFLLKNSKLQISIKILKLIDKKINNVIHNNDP